LKELTRAENKTGPAKRLVVDIDKCTGCMACTYACSSSRMGLHSPSHSRIRILKLEMSGLDAPVVCQQCEEPRCVEACPKQAIVRDAGTGILKIDEVLCNRCLLCAEACPYGAIQATPGGRKERKMLKCDLCGGEPQCVFWCDTGAIAYVDATERERIVASGENMIMAKKRFEIDTRVGR